MFLAFLPNRVEVYKNVHELALGVPVQQLNEAASMLVGIDLEKFEHSVDAARRLWWIVNPRRVRKPDFTGRRVPTFNVFGSRRFDERAKRELVFLEFKPGKNPGLDATYNKLARTKRLILTLLRRTGKEVFLEREVLETLEAGEQELLSKRPSAELWFKHKNQLIKDGFLKEMSLADAYANPAIRAKIPDQAYRTDDAEV